MMYQKRMIDHSRPHGSRFTILQRDILRTLLYFDVFGHPLRLSEIYRYLPSNSVTTSDIQRAIDAAPLSEILEKSSDFFYLKERTVDSVAQRLSKELRAHTMFTAARFMSSIIRRFPFVRAIFVSGELSKGVASRNSDIDFFIVAAEHRVWICRTLFTLFKKTVLLNSRKFFCYNHIASEHHLQIDDHNIYTATEIVTAFPIYNEHMFARFLAVNSWTASLLPNSVATVTRDDDEAPMRPLTERFLKLFLTDDQLDALDLWLMHRWQLIWKNRYATIPAEKRNELFRSNLFVSTAYAQDFLEKTLSRYRQRLISYGISTDP